MKKWQGDAKYALISLTEDVVAGDAERGLDVLRGAAVEEAAAAERGRRAQERLAADGRDLVERRRRGLEELRLARADDHKVEEVAPREALRHRGVKGVRHHAAAGARGGGRAVGRQLAGG
jgi:hypothetical protein